MSGSYTHAGKPPAQNKRFRLYGVFERKKCVVNLSKEKECIVNLSKVGEYEVCVQKPRVLVQGYYVDTVGKNTKAIKAYLSGQ